MTQVSNKGRDTFSIPMPSRRQTLMLVGFAYRRRLSSLDPQPRSLRCHVRAGTVHAWRFCLLRQERSGVEAEHI